MANSYYASGLAAFLAGSIDMDSDDVMVSLVADTYSHSGAHNAYDDVSVHVLATEQVSNPTITGGVFDHDAVTFESVAPGDTLAGYIYWVSFGGSPSADLLIAYFDTDDSGAISFATDGRDIVLTPNAAGVLEIGEA